MDEEILNDVDPTLDVVRRWAYDKRLFLLEQDEDMILADVKYFPLLLECAADTNCPKAKHCLSIVRQHCKFLLEWRHIDQAKPILAIAEEAVQSPHADIREWAVHFKQSAARLRDCDIWRREPRLE